MVSSLKNLERIRSLLRLATAQVGEDYFMLPVANAEGRMPLARYRERVYAYELYHRLRSIWPKAWPYSLAGEVDKAGHPLVREGYLNRAKPDLLVHVPGEMGRNLLVLEIKASTASESSRLKSDLCKLIQFRRLGYAAAAFLVFGESVERIREVAGLHRPSLKNLANIELWHHPGPNSPAARVEW